jgi:Amt family ammonium transporter
MALSISFSVNKHNIREWVSMELQLNAIWIMLAAILVIFMQGGFIMLEAGSTRMKNAGHVAGKTIFTFGLSSLVFWAVGWGLIYGPNTSAFIGWGDFFLNPYGLVAGDTPVAISWLFQSAFAAIALTIAFGGFAERAKLSVYLIFAVLFSVVVYPPIAHWIWAPGGWLFEHGKQDFAGSTVVHLTGAMAALAATILLKPRIGKYNKDGSANEISGHNQVYTALGVLILWFGWFGFNGGSTLAVGEGFFGYVAMNTQLAAGAGAILALLVSWAIMGKSDVPTMLNGALAGLVAITASCAFVDPWAAALIGAIAGILVVASMKFFDRMKIDDPIFALSVHGTAGVWGTISTGFFATETLAVGELGGWGQAGLFYGGGFTQLGIQVTGVLAAGAYAFIASFIILYIMKKVMGLRVTEEQEIIGLDLSEHGTYGYPEQMKKSANLNS